jgi:L-threonylcarbamoyladenylate synthase
VSSLDDAVRAIRRGGVVAIPTDTVYGLACDPANTAAVSRIYAIKHRPDGLELTLLAASLEDIQDDVDLSPAARTLAAAYWPGPLSIVSTLRGRRWAIPRDGTTLNVRIPDHPIALALLRRTGPLATTSANRHAEPAPDTAEGVTAALGAEVDTVLDGGRSAGLASTIIDCTTTTPRVLRDGPISATALLSLLGGFPASTMEGQRSQ